MSFLKVDSISKQFGDYKAVNNISFDVPKGIIFGLLGPNGAGKTTTIRMINNIIIPDGGTILLNDKIISSETQNNIGYLPEERGLYKKLKVIDQLIYFGRLKGLERNVARNRALEWLSKMGANGWENKKIQELSKGMQQKVQFIATILHQPDFFILDEPFSGFDPINTELLKSIIIDFKNNGKTIILSTHVMSQVEELCDEILLINKGQIILNGKVKEIKHQFGDNSYILEFDGEKEIFNTIDEINIMELNNEKVIFKLKEKSTETNSILQKIINNINIISFQRQEPSLHEIFINEVGKRNMKMDEVK